MGIAPAAVGYLSGRFSWIGCLVSAGLSMSVGYTLGWWIRFDDVYSLDPNGWSSYGALRPWANEIGDILGGCIFYGGTTMLMLQTKRR